MIKCTIVQKSQTTKAVVKNEFSPLHQTLLTFLGGAGYMAYSQLGKGAGGGGGGTTYLTGSYDLFTSMVLYTTGSTKVIMNLNKGGGR